MEDGMEQLLLKYLLMLEVIQLIKMMDIFGLEQRVQHLMEM